MITREAPVRTFSHQHQRTQNFYIERLRLEGYGDQRRLIVLSISESRTPFKAINAIMLPGLLQ